MRDGLYCKSSDSVVLNAHFIQRIKWWNRLLGDSLRKGRQTSASLQKLVVPLVSLEDHCDTQPTGHQWGCGPSCRGQTESWVNACALSSLLLYFPFLFPTIFLLVSLFLSAFNLILRPTALHGISTVRWDGPLVLPSLRRTSEKQISAQTGKWVRI